MKQATRLIMVAGALALAGCVSQGPPGSAARNASGSGAAPNASAAHAKSDTFKPPADYRRVVRDGEVKFCRKFYPTGTLAESQTECLTEAELKDRENSNRLMLEDAQRMRAATPGGGVPPGMGH